MLGNKQIRIGRLTAQLAPALCKFRDGYIYFGNNRRVRVLALAPKPVNI
jgi:hypothetical protein